MDTTSQQLCNIDLTNKTAMFNFFDAIFGWDPKWFNDSMTSSIKNTITMDQILGNNCPKLNTISLCYNNEEEYHYTMIPLIIHEFFYTLMKDMSKEQDYLYYYDDDAEKITDRKAFGVVKDVHDQTFQNFFMKNLNLKFKFVKILVASYNSTTSLPRRGDLLILKKNKKKIFAYVYDIICSEATKKKNRLFINNYIVITRDILFNKNQRIKLTSVKSIKQNIRVLQAVTNLSQSPLCNLILKPNYNDYNMSIGNDNLTLSFKQKLNPIQIKIVNGVVKTVEESKPKICLIQGPPGTGKSTVITAMIYELFNKNKNIKILLCAPSNKAVDGLLLKLIDVHNEMKLKGININIVRIGPEEKIDPKINSAIGLSTLVLKENNSFNKKNKKDSKYEEEILKNANVIASTLTSCYSYRMKMIFGKKNGIKIPICIVDEAGQSSEAVTLIPLMLGIETLVLVGDTKQLPPTIISQDAKTHGMDLSLFAKAENIFKNTFNNPILMLNVQYRMVNEISSWPNKHFYNGKILNADDNKITFPLCNYKILNYNSKQSYCEFTNKPEAKIIFKLLDVIVDQFEKLNIINKNPNMSVITPYRHQQQIITNMIITKCVKIEDLLIIEFDKLKLYKKNNTSIRFLDENNNDILICEEKKKKWCRDNEKSSINIDEIGIQLLSPFLENQLLENQILENQLLEMLNIENVQIKNEQKLTVNIDEENNNDTDEQCSSNITNDITKIINGMSKSSINSDNQVDKSQQTNCNVKKKHFVKRKTADFYNNKNKKLDKTNKMYKTKTEEKIAKFNELKLFEQKIKDKIVKSKEIIISLFDNTIDKINTQNIDIKKGEKDELFTLHEINEIEIILENIDKLFKLYDKWKNIEVNTVDSFQGQERDIIIMSCVRSNGIGFVADPNRLNVGLTRAKHTLIICGNFNTFRNNTMWCDLLDDAEVRGSYVNLNEDLESDDLKNLIFIN